jgi:hypothetical protein
MGVISLRGRSAAMGLRRVDAQVAALRKVLPQQAVGRSYVCQAALASVSAVFAGTVAA